MKQNKHIGKCEEYYAEVEKYMRDVNNSKSFLLPEFTLNLYMSSIARSLAVIADKMCEEDEHA